MGLLLLVLPVLWTVTNGDVPDGVKSGTHCFWLLQLEAYRGYGE